MCILRDRPKVRKLSAEVEDKEAKPNAARSLPSSLPPSSQPASQPPTSQPLRPPHAPGEESPGARKVRARARGPSEQTPSVRPVTRLHSGVRAAPTSPLDHPPFAPDPSFLPLPLPARCPTACELLERCRLPPQRCAPWGVLLPARRGLPLSPPLRGASSRPQHSVPTPWPPLPPPGPRQVYKHQPGACFPGSTSPPPPSSPQCGTIHFRAGADRKGVRLRAHRGSAAGEWAVPAAR